jgi:hypothetical protein
MNKLQVKEHLRNGALYQPMTESSLDEEWKRRLLCQYAMHKQLNSALQERNGFSKSLVYIGVPGMCLLLAFAVYFGFLQPGDWLEKFVLAADFDIPPIGVKESLVFAALVNGLTLLIRKRGFWL